MVTWSIDFFITCLSHNLSRDSMSVMLVSMMTATKHNIADSASRL